MVQFYDSISETLGQWALSQQLFFLASAPLSGHHINVSPKGLPASTLHIFTPNRVAYIDYTGSGIETVSHVYENGRVTVMFCSFDKAPRIMRWFCRGRVVEWDCEEFDVLVKEMGKGGEGTVGARAIVVLDVFKVQTSCGYAVPVLQEGTGEQGMVGGGAKAWLKDRDTLGHFAKTTIEKGAMDEYRQTKNVRSLDGCPGLRVARRQKGESMMLEDGLAWLRRVGRQWDAVLFGALLAVVAMVALGALPVPGFGVRVPSAVRIMG